MEYNLNRFDFVLKNNSEENKLYGSFSESTKDEINLTRRSVSARALWLYDWILFALHGSLVILRGGRYETE